MKTLWILRHAHADGGGPGTEDHERPLSDRGLDEARDAGRFLGAAEVPPALILSSSAVRARETAEAVSVSLDDGIELRLDRRLYLAGPSTISDLVADLANGVESVLVVAHNPGLEELAAALAGSPIGLPPAGMLEIAVPADRWDALHAMPACRLRRRWTPRAN